MTCMNLRSEAESANEALEIFNRRRPHADSSSNASGSAVRHWANPSFENFRPNNKFEIPEVATDRPRSTFGIYGMCGQSAENHVRVAMRHCPKCKQMMSSCVKVCIHCDEVISKSRSRHAAKTIKIACVLIGLQLINTAHAYYNHSPAQTISMSSGQVEISKTPQMTWPGVQFSR